MLSELGDFTGAGSVSSACLTGLVQQCDLQVKAHTGCARFLVLVSKLLIYVTVDCLHSACELFPH